MAETPEPTPVPSSTLLLVRDGASGLEVLMVERHRQIDFAPGAMVFPGGKLDDADAAPELHAHCRGIDGLDAAGIALRVGALREAFEECGVLLARVRGEEGIVPATRALGIERRHREAVHAGKTTLLRMVEEEDLELACDLLVPFAHWITPEGSPRRYDTHFFLVAAPRDQVAAHDGKESVDSVWISPPAAIAEEKSEKRTIVFPTLMQLRKLGHSGDIASALEAARGTPIVTVLPWVEPGEAGPTICIPEDAGYDLQRVPLAEAFKTSHGTRRKE
jgi:8-oxo-dGTP pyrophosphatase MutT (NUDIX family)